jgi:hypothetical protein
MCLLKEKAAVRVAKQSYEKERCDVPCANPAAVEKLKSDKHPR